MDCSASFTSFIIGTTAAGKTKLSLSLEKNEEKNYEILSCDSMQLYKEATIMTAKATAQEQAIIKHHGIDLLNLNDEGFNRSKWASLSGDLIQKIISSNKLPVVVGGTHYYMETVMFQQQQEEEQQNILHQEAKFANPYEKLKEIDPLAAEKFHPNDIRRIENSLLYYHQTGRLPSDIPDFHSSESKLTNNKFLILWPKWKNKELLQAKVTQRINEMVYKDGGIEEVLKIFTILSATQINKGGVLQSIGYRQFTEAYKYYKLMEEPPCLQVLLEDEKFACLLKEGIQQLINDTMKYTKKQLQWIRNRILANANIETIRKRLFLFEFDLDFTGQVIEPAQEIFAIFREISSQNLFDVIDSNEEIFESFFKGKEYLKQYMVPKEKINELIAIQQKKLRKNWKKMNCEKCNKQANGPFEWQQHINSKFHKKNVKNIQKHENQEDKQNNEEEKQDNSEEEKKHSDPE